MTKKVQGEQEVFAYRVGEDLICPKCYQEAEQDLSNNSQAKVRGKPLTADNIKFYICQRCGTNKGDPNFLLTKLSSAAEQRDRKKLGESSLSTENKRVQGEQEVFAYRVGEDLICPACHELSVKILAVHEIEPTRSEPVKRGDIEGFICDQCGLIRGDYKVSSVQELRHLQEKLDLLDLTEVSNVSNDVNISSDIGGTNGERRGRNPKSVLDLEDMLEDCAGKVEFLDDFFSHGHEPDDEFFSERGASGFHCILVDLEDDLEFVIEGMKAIRDQEGHKGLKPAAKDIADAVRPFQEAVEAARSTRKI